jgi:hypothetical protein
VIEALDFDKPQTKQMADLLGKLELTGKKVLILTAEVRHDVLRSANNIPRVNVMRYADASALDVLWADSLLIEEAAFAGHSLSSASHKSVTGRARRVLKEAEAQAASKPDKQDKKQSAAKKADAKLKDGDDA